MSLSGERYIFITFTLFTTFTRWNLSFCHIERHRSRIPSTSLRFAQDFGCGLPLPHPNDRNIGACRGPRRLDRRFFKNRLYCPDTALSLPVSIGFSRFFRVSKGLSVMSFGISSAVKLNSVLPKAGAATGVRAERPKIQNPTTILQASIGDRRSCISRCRCAMAAGGQLQILLRVRGPGSHLRTECPATGS